MIGDRYALETLIGQGPSAEVWRAMDTRLDRPVALKRLKPDAIGDPTAVSRFEREARAAAGLSHPGIVTILDTGRDGAAPWFVMELVDGETVAAMIARGGPLEVNRAVSLGVQVARALQHAHTSGLVHRDIKPGNIMVRTDGRAQLVDFGITTGHLDVRLTQTGMVMGSLSYLAPEIAAGASSSPQADIYSLGVTLYEMLAGVPPFPGESIAETVLAHQQLSPPPLQPSVPEWLQSVVRRCLEKDPAERFASAGMLAAALAEGGGIVASASAGAPVVHDGTGKSNVTPVGGIPISDATRAIPQLPAAMAPDDNAPNKRKRWLWVVGLALALFVIFIALSGPPEVETLTAPTSTTETNEVITTTAGQATIERETIVERLIVITERLRTVVEASPMSSEGAAAIVESVDEAVTAWQNDHVSAAQEHVDEAFAQAEEITVPLLRPLVEGFLRQLAEAMGLSAIG